MSFSTHTKPFGPGSQVTLASPKLRATFSTLGAAIVSVKVPGGNKDFVEVNCQYGDDYQEALKCGNYLGVTVGRFAGRVGNGRFKLPGSDEEFHTDRNMGEHTLHGGTNAFSKKQWTPQVIDDDDRLAVVFRYVSPDGENGFPGEVLCKVTYEIPKSEPNVLNMYFWGEVTRGSVHPATIMNMFNHNYWNFNGVTAGTKNPKVYNIRLHMPKATMVAETDEQAIPTGKFLDVTSIPSMNFTKAKALGDGINDKAALNRDPCGYDHPFLMEGYSPKLDESRNHYPNKNFEVPRPMLEHATVYSPSSQVGMRIKSTFPALWVYTANNLPETLNRKHNNFTRHDCVCLEPQHLPNAINVPTFFPEVTVVTRDKPYREVIRAEFFSGSANKL